MDQVSNVALANGTANDGVSPSKNFDLKLLGCSTATKNKVQVTFTGPAGVGGRLGISGSASGASIALVYAGNPVILGTPTAVQALSNGDNTLTFTAYLKGDGVAIVPGDFSAVTNFTLTYP